MAVGTIGSMVELGVWQRRGLLTLFGFAVATLLGAVVTFVAHNWAYLSTGGKLGGIGVLLLVAAGLWVWRRFDGPAAVSFGIAAQVLIGVWLAAAGQIFQAPGGLQDLALNWAVLGFPFALASRSWAHWAVWLAVVFLATVSPVGLMLYEWLGEDFRLFRYAASGALFAAAMVVSLRWGPPHWFTALSATASVFLLTVFGARSVFDGIFDDNPAGMLLAVPAVLLMSASGALAFRRRRRASAALFATGGVFVLTLLLLRPLWEIVGDDTLGILVSLLITGGATFGLVKIFQHIVANSPDPAGDAMDGHDGTPWYMDALIAIGGFVTAMLGVGFLGSFIGLIAALTDSLEAALIVIGSAIYSASIWFRRKEPGQFLRFMLDTLILIGGSAIIGGFGILLVDLDTSQASFIFVGLLIIGLSVLTAVLVPRDRILHVVLALGVIAGVLLTLFGFELSETVFLMVGAVLFSLIGVAFAVEPFGGQRRLTVAVVFLLSAIVSALVFDMVSKLPEWSVIPRVANAAILLLGLAWMARRLGRETLPSALVTGALAVIAFVLPLGSAPSLLLLMLGYALRSRALFAIGVAAMAYFLFATYYDLSLTLMQLSAMMALTGGALLALWWTAQRRVEAVA